MNLRATRTTSATARLPRDPKYKEIDKSALRAIVQAAVNVELFTIPLYMTSLYSIHGVHQINSSGLDYYKGRLWPGAATTANPQSANENAFNIIFSVFIEEMLHLQMAANLAVAVGVVPSFTSSALQDPKRHGWTCYGDNLTVIPHIVDLQDTTTYENVKVKLDALNSSQIELFLAIEQSAEKAEKDIKPDRRSKYFPIAPFQDWTVESNENDLPMFGSIGWMYRCYVDYLNIVYTDNSTLWEAVYNSASLQRDQFNLANSGHPFREYTQLDTTLLGWLPIKGREKAVDMINAITDQGEGSVYVPRPTRGAFDEVLDRYRPAKDALEADYPAYTDTGADAPSSDAVARFDNSQPDHYERFEELKLKLQQGAVLTWDQWHSQGNQWSAELLVTKDYDPSQAPKDIPKPDEVAGALNRLKTTEGMYERFSQVSVGAIAGVTTVLDQYWKDPKTTFPNPSMYGSGDRVSICWAIFGQPPDLSQGIGAVQQGHLYHACQGLDLDPTADQNCAAVEVYHTCKGSNSCKAQGGCGFAQTEQGGGSCSSQSPAPDAARSGCNPFAIVYTAPSDNKCSTFGGCAVPISASQLYPKSGTMQLYNFVGSQNTPDQLGTILFHPGEGVHDVAWKAYCDVMQARASKPGTKPAPNDLRLALPPST